ncbi:hypothetical protein [Novosphingobium barchaimii]|uniref:hypothetical protein n=1 Tax=Novosphingobium barchaimii TaxID=1420591 RepID=UPI000AED6665|nr:hypothetical protein [Novosphingobium barchaimii]
MLRQNKAYPYGALLAPLYFVNDRALLLDEGFVQLRSDWDLRRAVAPLHRGMVRPQWTRSCQRGTAGGIQPPPYRSLGRDQSVR